MPTWRSPDVVDKGKLLTLTTSEALTHKVADFTRGYARPRRSRSRGLRDAEIRRASQTWAETFVRFLTNPVVSSLLMTIGMLGLLVEIRTPGFARSRRRRPAVAGTVLLGPLDRAARRLGGAAAGRRRRDPARSRSVRHPGLRRGGRRRHRRARGRARDDARRRRSNRLRHHRGIRTRGDLDAVWRSPAGSRCSACCHGSRSAADSCSIRKWALRRATRRRRRAIGCSSVVPVPPCRRSGRPASPTSMASRVDVVSDGGFIDAGAAIEVTRVDGNRVVVRERPTTRNGDTS